jgi:hypothetical protein
VEDTEFRTTAEGELSERPLQVGIVDNDIETLCGEPLPQEFRFWKIFRHKYSSHAGMVAPYGRKAGRS